MDYNFDKDLTEHGYHVLMDANTKTYYMKPREVCFYAYTSASNFKADMFTKNARLVQTDHDDFRSLATELFNAGFVYGYIDNKKIQIRPESMLHYNRNANDIAFTQYVLTSDEKYLTIIRKSQLFTICQIDGEKILFPTVEIGENKTAILAYTSTGKIPQKMLDMYVGYHIVYMAYNVPCIINEQVIVE